MSDVTVTVGANTTPLNEAMRRVEGSIASLSKKFGGLGGIIAGAGIGSAILSIIEKGDAIGDMSQRFNVPAEILQKLGVSAEFTSTSMESVARGLAKMQAAGMAANDIYAFADSVAAAKTENEAFAIAAGVLGNKLATQLLPMLEIGGSEMRRLGESATVMSDKTVEAMSGLQDEVFKLKSAGQNILAFIVTPLAKGVEVAQELGKAIGAIYVASTQGIEAARDAVADVELKEWQAQVMKERTAKAQGARVDDSDTKKSEDDAKLKEEERAANKLADEKAKMDADAAKESAREYEKAYKQAQREIAEDNERYKKIGQKDAALRKEFGKEEDAIARRAGQTVFQAGVSSLAAIGGGGRVGAQNSEAETLKNMREQSQTLKDIRSELEELNNATSTI